MTLIRGHRQRAAGQVVQLSGRVRRPETLIANVSASANGRSVIVATWDIVLTTG